MAMMSTALLICCLTSSRIPTHHVARELSNSKPIASGPGTYTENAICFTGHLWPATIWLPRTLTTSFFYYS